MEEIKKVEIVQVDYKCPKCEEGYLRPTGTCFTTNPPMYPHRCTHCNYAETFTGKTYPYIDHRPISSFTSL